MRLRFYFAVTWSVLVVSLNACTSQSPSANPSSDKFVVSNLRSGLVSFASNGNPFVSTPGTDFTYQETGTCTAAGEQIRCIWHGFEFDYSSRSCPSAWCKSTARKS